MTAHALAKALPDTLAIPAASTRRRGALGRTAPPADGPVPFDARELQDTQDDELRLERAAEAMRQACNSGRLADASAAAAAAMPKRESHPPRSSLLQLLAQAQPMPLGAPDENRLYLLQRLSGAPMGLLRLRDNGRISASGLTELARWTLSDGAIELHGRDGRLVSRFTLAGTHGQDQRLYMGESLQDGTLHLLTEVSCSYTRLRMLDPELAGPFCSLYDIAQMVDAPLPARPVVVLATPHTGAQRLLRLLNSHPRLLVDGELLHPLHIGQAAGELRSDEAGALHVLRGRDPMYFARLMMNRSHDLDGRRLDSSTQRGFTLDPMQSRQAFDWVMDNPSFRVVHLVRENLLAEYASVLAAGADSPRRARLPFEPDRFARFIEMKTQYLAMVRQRLDARSGAWAEIETGAMHRSHIETLLGFLTGDGAAACLPPGALARHRAERTIERFDNPQAVRQCLDHLGCAHWADGEQPNAAD